jgi:hypothetical protein
MERLIQVKNVTVSAASIAIIVTIRINGETRGVVIVKRTKAYQSIPGSVKVDAVLLAIVSQRNPRLDRLEIDCAHRRLPPS